ncbi:MAG TPA: FISUMP domain-containing protein [Cyclobacteriaceae bacterium]|nr:FISUMP domain-containing protein [Cyclobacteriaceae bacterium]
MKSLNPWVVCLCLLFAISGCKKEEDEPAPNDGGINFGSHDFGSMTDEEGNTYKTIVIGSATWMAENLKVTKLNDGTDIPAVPAAQWISRTAPAYYDGSAEFIAIYGRHYNAAASIKACPTGWHLPSSKEWDDLASAVGGMSVAGGKLKETGIQHWVNPNVAAENSFGFTGLPAGSIHIGALRDRGSDGYWWANDQITFYYASASLAQMRTKSTATPDNGLSIRCVKD